MEILIIGGIIVLIMVIVSTKVKSSAAEAFRPEVVAKDGFIIEKPEGFMYPLRDKPDFPFEAYSKLFGEKMTRNIWRARTRLRITDGANLQKLVDEIKSDEEENFVSEKILSDLPDGKKGIIIRTEKTESDFDDNVDYKIFRKIIESDKHGKTYELRSTLLKAYAEEYTDRICRMMESFRLK